MYSILARYDSSFSKPDQTVWPTSAEPASNRMRTGPSWAHNINSQLGSLPWRVHVTLANGRSSEQESKSKRRPLPCRFYLSHYRNLAGLNTPLHGEDLTVPCTHSTYYSIHVLWIVDQQCVFGSRCTSQAVLVETETGSLAQGLLPFRVRFSSDLTASVMCVLIVLKGSSPG